MVGLFLFGLSLRLKETADLLLAPSWQTRVAAAALALPVLPAAGLVYLALTRSVKLKRVLPMVALVLLGAAGAAALLVFLQHNWLFGPELRYAARSSEGREAGVWYGGFLGCDWELYASEPGEQLSRQVDRKGVECSDPGQPGVRWLSDGGAELAIDGGTPSKPWSLFPAWN